MRVFVLAGRTCVNCFMRSPLQGLYSGLKLPLAILATTCGNALLNGMLAPLLRLNLTFRQSLLAVLFSFTITAILLGGFSPLAAFVVWNTPVLTQATTLQSPEYGFLQLTIAALITASVGLALGLASLRIMHALVARWRGWLAGGLFVATAVGLAAFGVYLGRFVRLNSWDVAFTPVKLAREIGGTLVEMFAHPHQAVFPVMFAFFLFLSYALFHALSCLPHLKAVESGGA